MQFFHATDPTNVAGQYVTPVQFKSQGPQLLQSHGWLDATLLEDFAMKDFNPMKRDTWPNVLPSQDLLFMDRVASKRGQVSKQRRVHAHHIRKPSTKAPLLSVVFVRWGGEDAVPEKADSEGSNDGDWGQYGAPASNGYMSALVREGLMAHPRLGTESKQVKFEAFSLFVKNSKDMGEIGTGSMSNWLASCLKGKKTATCWMLWPAEWIDCRGSDYAAYITRCEFFQAMRSLESVGLRTAFPHPADQYEHITSKAWMATLSLQSQAKLPAATLVSKGNVLSNPKRAAKNALAALAYVRGQNPFPVGDGEQAAPSVINKDGVSKGVVKLGWSWEARYVSIFKGEEDLVTKLQDMFSDPGCLASTCIVQEWVDFDFEMRLYFLPPDDWNPSEKLQPARIECNAWSGSMDNGERRNFHKLTEAIILSDYWKEDKEAYKSARKQAINISQYLLGWLLLNDAQPVPMIRLDFMLLRTGPGKARVVFGEYCEMGACCLGWAEGPPTIWKRAIDNALL